MCGLFGAIGKRINPYIIRALAIANRERGVDALGFFSPSGKMLKIAHDPLYLLADEDFATFIDMTCAKGWFIAGHTRQSTHTNATRDDCAHPFRYGRYVGSHNGIVRYPTNAGYKVDSEYLIDSLKQFNGDYQKAFENISGYWGLTWFDGECFYLQSYNCEIAIGKLKGVWYYSSDIAHLEACVRPDEKTMTILDSGDTLQFNCKLRHKTMPQFHSKTFYRPYIPVKGGKLYGNVETPIATGSIPEPDDELEARYRKWEGDEDWRDAWAEYSAGSEHEKD